MFNFMMKKMLKNQMKGIPEDQQNMILEAFEKNPDFFKEMAAKIQQKIKEGKGQQQAAMEVMRENQERLREIMRK
jgi:hypothetical protein